MTTPRVVRSGVAETDVTLRRRVPSPYSRGEAGGRFCGQDRSPRDRSGSMN